jgi:RNA polymerase sigma factor (sigma-70 family)
MRNGSKTAVLQSVDTLFHLGRAGEWSDAELLDHFVSRSGKTRDAAFRVLLDRHGPMVLDVCRNVLQNAHDAEDAFQATFLILARRARSIRRRRSVGSWLFGVARRVATRARADAARRKVRERAAARKIATPAPTTAEEATPALFEEIARLPAAYREPVVLCYLQGMSYKSACERLGCPIGTLSVRLNRARERLRAQLARRGETIALLGEIGRPLTARDRLPLSWALLDATTQRAATLSAGRMPAGGLVPSSIISRVEGVTFTMFARQITARIISALALGVLCLGTGVFAFQVINKMSVATRNAAQPDNPRARSVNNLRQIGLAIMKFEAANGFLPQPAINDPNTRKPLLSWRVAVLPWMFGGQELFEQFHLNEPWDSQHNKTLLAKMPAYYAPVVGKPEEPFTTFYQVFVGPGTAFEALPGNGALTIPIIRDGCANTLGVVEGGRPVPWTKPEDLPFQPDQPLPQLGGLFADRFNVTFLDGSVFCVAREADERLLKGLITRAGGEPVSRDRLPQLPLSGPSQPEKPPAAGSPDAIRKAAATNPQPGPSERLKFARQAFDMIEQLRRAGQGASIEDYHKWSVRLLEAERDTSKTVAEELSALEQHRDRMRTERERAEALRRAGNLGPLEVLDAEYWDAEARAWLEKAKEHPTGPTRR